MISSTMYKTTHFQQRMSQRGIRQACIELTLAYGDKKGDKTTFDKKLCRKMLEELEAIKKALTHIQHIGGYTVVESEGRLITAYRKDSYSRNKALKGHC